MCLLCKTLQKVFFLFEPSRGMQRVLCMFWVHVMHDKGIGGIQNILSMEWIYVIRVWGFINKKVIIHVLVWSIWSWPQSPFKVNLYNTLLEIFGFTTVVCN